MCGGEVSCECCVVYIGVSNHVIWEVCVNLHVLCGVMVCRYVCTCVRTYVRTTVFVQHLNIHCTSIPFQVHTYVRIYTFTCMCQIDYACLSLECHPL